MNPAQHTASESRPRSPVRPPVVELYGRRQIHAPRKQPQQVEQPEPQPRHRVVIARIAQVQKSQHVLVDEVEPEEAVIRAALAVHREIEVRRIAQRGQHVPRRCDQQQQRNSRRRPQPPPRPSREKLPRETQVEQSPLRPEIPPRSRPFSSSPVPIAAHIRQRPQPRRALRRRPARAADPTSPPSPHSVRIASGISMRVNRNSPTEVASASPAYSPAALSESPRRKPRRHPAQQHRRQRQRNPRRPVVHAENPERHRDHPVLAAGISPGTRCRPGAPSPSRPIAACCAQSAPAPRPHRPSATAG